MENLNFELSVFQNLIKEYESLHEKKGGTGAKLYQVEQNLLKAVGAQSRLCLLPQVTNNASQIEPVMQQNIHQTYERNFKAHDRLLLTNQKDLLKLQK